MGIIGDAFRGANISSELESSNEDTETVVAKLLSIVDMFISSHENEVRKIFVSPMNIMQKKPAELKDVEVVVVQDWSNTLVADTMLAAEEMFDCLIDGEFDEIPGGIKVRFEKRVPDKKPMLLLYSKNCNFLSQDSEFYDAIDRVVNEYGCSVSVPADCEQEGLMGIFIHCSTPDKAIRLESFLRDFKYCYGIEYTGEKKKLGDAKFFYVPVLGKHKLDYDLPYTYIDESNYGSSDDNQVGV